MSDSKYLHVCTPECFCPQCGKHLIGGIGEETSFGYEMLALCVDGHFKKVIGSVTYASTQEAIVK